MNLLAYYFLHTFKNSIKKIFKTWVAVFIIACVLIGAIIGISVAVVADKSDNQSSQQDISQVEEVQEDEVKADKMDKDDVLAIVEMIVGGVVILITLYSSYNFV